MHTNTKGAIVVSLGFLPSSVWAASADAGGPYDVTAGDTVEMSGVDSETAACDLQTLYGWSATTDGVVDEAYRTDTNSVFDAAELDGPTEVEVQLVVLCTSENDDGTTEVEQEEAWTEVTIENADPEITTIDVDTEVDEGDELVLSAEATDPEPADTLDYTWSFSDGATLSGHTVSRSVADDGVLIVTVSAEDDDGGSASATVEVSVNNVAPSLSQPEDDVIEPDEAYEISLTCTDPGADALTWSSDLPSGATFWREEDDTANITWTGTSEGSFSFTVQVEDDDGGSDSVSWSVLVQSGEDTEEDTGKDHEVNDSGGTTEPTQDLPPDPNAFRDTADRITSSAQQGTGCTCGQGPSRPTGLLWSACLLFLLRWRRADPALETR